MPVYNIKNVLMVFSLTMEMIWLFLTAYGNSKKFKLKWHQKIILLTEKHTAGPQNQDGLGDLAPLLEYISVCVRPWSVSAAVSDVHHQTTLEDQDASQWSPGRACALETQNQLGKQTKTHQKYTFKMSDFRFRSYSFL